MTKMKGIDKEYSFYSSIIAGFNNIFNKKGKAKGPTQNVKHYSGIYS